MITNTGGERGSIRREDADGSFWRLRAVLFPVKRFWGSGFCASAATNFKIKLSNYAHDWTLHLWTPPLSSFSLLHFILMHLISVLIDLPPCSSLSCRTFLCHLCLSPFISPLHIPTPTDEPSSHLPLFALLFLLSFPSVISATFLLLVCAWRCCSTTKRKKKASSSSSSVSSSHQTNLRLCLSTKRFELSNCSC